MAELLATPLIAAPVVSGVTASVLRVGDVERFELSQFCVADLRVKQAVGGRNFGICYSSGDMARNAILASEHSSLAQLDDFVMTNICPLNTELNLRAWQRLQHWIPQAAQERNHVVILASHIFGPTPRIIVNGAAVGTQIPDAL